MTRLPLLVSSLPRLACRALSASLAGGQPTADPRALHTGNCWCLGNVATVCDHAVNLEFYPNYSVTTNHCTWSSNIVYYAGRLTCDLVHYSPPPGVMGSEGAIETCAYRGIVERS